jgi:hypothetical protein
MGLSFHSNHSQPDPGATGQTGEISFCNLYSQQPPANTCRCWVTHQQRSQSSTVAWVIPSTQAIRRGTIAPQSAQAPATGLSVLHSRVSMGHHLCIGTSAPIAHG